MISKFNFSNLEVIHGRNRYLDNLRGIAIVLVVSMHSMQLGNSLVTNKSDFITQSISYGKYGVELFFVLSGFLLASIYSFESRFSHRLYYLRRASRIFPLWVFFLIIQIAYSSISEDTSFDRALNPVGNVNENMHQPLVVIALTLTFTLFLSASLWNVVMPGGWSIQAEVAHYLIFPYLRKFSFRKVLMTWSCLNFFSAMAYINASKLQDINWILKSLLESWLRLGIYSTFSFFLIGIILFKAYSLRSRFADFDMHSIDKKNTFAASVFLFSQFIIPCPQGFQIEALGVVTLAMIFAALFLNFRLATWLLNTLGRYSYFIYFSHFLFLEILGKIASRRQVEIDFYGSQLIVIPILLATLSVCLLVAVPSMKYFEKPIIGRAHTQK